MAWISGILDWRASARMNHFYVKLKFLEDDVKRLATNQRALKDLLERVDHLESQAVELDLPEEFSDR